MRAALVTYVAVAICHASNAFTHSPTTLVAIHRSSSKLFPDTIFVHPNDDAEATPLQFERGTTVSPSLRRRLRCAGEQAWERMDTMKTAGLCDNGMEPLQSGFKTNVGLLVGAFLFKWYRARFINKVCMCRMCVSRCQRGRSFPSHHLYANSPIDSSLGSSTSMVST